MDHLVIGMADKKFRLVAISGKNTVEEARARHNLSHTATATLGRVLLGAGLFASSLKSEDERITLQFNGQGPIAPVLAIADRKVSVKGYCGNGQVELELNPAGKLDVGGAVGEGNLYIFREIDNQEPYTGTVPIQTGEIGDDLAYYLQKSEQIPSAVGLGVLVDSTGFVRSAAGLLVQALPGVSDDDLISLESKLAGIGSLSHRFDEGQTPVMLLNELFPTWDRLEKRPFAFSCDCSKLRFSGGLLSLGIDELTGLIKNKEPVEIICRFCGKQYLFSTGEIEELMKKV